MRATVSRSRSRTMSLTNFLMARATALPALVTYCFMESASVSAVLRRARGRKAAERHATSREYAARREASQFVKTLDSRTRARDRCRRAGLRCCVALVGLSASSRRVPGNQRILDGRCARRTLWLSRVRPGWFIWARVPGGHARGLGSSLIGWLATGAPRAADGDPGGLDCQQAARRRLAAARRTRSPGRSAVFLAFVMVTVLVSLSLGHPYAIQDGLTPAFLLLLFPLSDIAARPGGARWLLRVFLISGPRARRRSDSS